MKRCRYTCRLDTEVILNSRIATEGNMASLSHIPGSNFLGVVARHYESFGASAYDIFHAGKVRFGDGLPINQGSSSYRMPISAMQEKGSKQGSVYLQHLTLGEDGNFLDGLRQMQLKQLRDRFMDGSGSEIPAVRKTFRLKSAYDADTRRSKDEQMFGFESILRGQIFLFSVDYADDELKGKVESRLLGTQRIGKSRSAEYGWVTIDRAKDIPEEPGRLSGSRSCLVYLASHLCVFDACGMPTYQPDPLDFGIQGGRIDWVRSQVRTISWAPWNAKRNTTDTQRHAIAAGSVLRVVATGDALTIAAASGTAGAFQSEGLGRFIIDPTFLDGIPETAQAMHIRTFVKTPSAPNAPSDLNMYEPKSRLGHFLVSRYKGRRSEQSFMEAVMAAIGSAEAEQLLKSDVTKAQWGAIRGISETCVRVGKQQGMDMLKKKLFDDIRRDRHGKDIQYAYLRHGVSYEQVWGADNERLLKLFEGIVEMYKEHGPAFTARFCSELSKKIDH